MVAIVRGSSDEKAAERLRSGFDSGDPQLLQRFDALSKHLVVYAGVLHASDLLCQSNASQVSCICPWIVQKTVDLLPKTKQTRCGKVCIGHVLMGIFSCVFAPAHVLRQKH